MMCCLWFAPTLTKARLIIFKRQIKSLNEAKQREPTADPISRWQRQKKHFGINLIIPILKNE